MFYLSIFKDIFSNYKWPCLRLIVSSLLLFLITTQFYFFDNQIKVWVGRDKTYPYFWTVISGKISTQEVQNKLLELPYIYKVTKNESINIHDKAKELIEKHEVKVPDSIYDLDYNSFKIVLNPDIDKKKIELVKEYIARIAGSDNLMMSDIKSNEWNENKFVDKFINNLTDYASAILLLFSVGIWLISFAKFNHELNQYFYLLDQYGRNKMIAYKMTSQVLTIVLFATIFLAQIMLNNFTFWGFLLSILFIILFPFLSMRKTGWRAQ